jgi:CRP-like cAMP-binding protein
VLEFGKDHHDSYSNYGVQYFVNDMARNDSTGSRVKKRIYAALQRARIPLAIPAQMQLQQTHDADHVARHREREAKAHLDAIKTIGLLRVLDDAELRTLADGLQPAMFDAGETITRQGAIAHYLYVLTAGHVEIRTKVDPDGDGPAQPLSRTVAKLAAPDFFGEMGMITGEPRFADVVAVTDVECYRLDRATFETVLLARPDIADELARKLAERRVGLIAVRDGLDEAARAAREASEQAKILRSIKSFFGL